MASSSSKSSSSASANQSPPPLQRTADGQVDFDSIPDVIQWFLDFDPRVAVVKHPRVEEVFQWKQEQTRLDGEEVFQFNRAEDRLAIGIIKAIAEHTSERGLHDWITRLLNALDAAAKGNEDTTKAYGLDLETGGSAVTEAQKIPTLRGRNDFLLNCWIEALCTAEIRVLGWLYQEIYGRPFAP